MGKLNIRCALCGGGRELTSLKQCPIGNGVLRLRTSYTPSALRLSLEAPSILSTTVRKHLSPHWPAIYMVFPLLRVFKSILLLNIFPLTITFELADYTYFFLLSLSLVGTCLFEFSWHLLPCFEKVLESVILPFAIFNALKCIQLNQQWLFSFAACYFLFELCTSY